MILITGGAGYLGSTLTTLLLESKQPVRVIDNRMHSQPIGRMANDPNLEFVEADLRDSDALARAVEGVNTVIHLAAIVGDPACARDPELAQAVNLGASRDLIRLAQERGVKQFVFASTCSNYGRIADNATPATEDHELRPLSLYAETKVSIEKDLLAQRSSSTAFSILRFATLYGVSPRMRFDLTVNEFVMKMLIERAITVYGEQFWRPYVHVRDAAAAIEGLLAAGPVRGGAGAIFNVGDTGENYTKRDLIELIQARTGPAEIRRVEKLEDPRSYKVSFERIRSRFGYSVKWRVPDGINEIASAIECNAFPNLRDPVYYN